MQIIRIEDDEGFGPHGYGSNSDRIFEGALYTKYCKRNPNPWEEGLMFGSDYFCGFNSLTQLTKWFVKKERKMLAEAGFKLVIYKVSEDFVHVSKRQVTFVKSKAKKTGEIPL